MLAFDFGLKRIGVAVGNSLSAAAEPLEIIEADNEAGRFQRIEALLKEWSPARLVVGVPRHPDGQPHEMTQRCERFARQLHGRFGMPVATVDERYSSVDAEDAWRDGGGGGGASGGRRARRGGRGAGTDLHGQRLDAEAAAIILRQYWSEQGSP